MFCPNPTIVCIGQTVMDYRFTVAQIPSRAEKYKASDFQVLPGGMAAGAAIAAARLGARVVLASKVGRDSTADTLLTFLANEGIDSQFIERVEGCHTAVSAVCIDPSGERQVVHAPTEAFNRGQPIDVGQLPLAKALLVDPRWPEASFAALQWAYSHGIPSVLDADIAPREVITRLMPLTDWAVFSAHGLAYLFPGLSDETRVMKAQSLGARHVAVTCGKAGVQWLEHLQLQQIAAAPVDVVDTTGAGDVFHGALAFALAASEIHSARPLLEFANAIAGEKVRAGLGSLGAPYAEQVQPTIQQLNASQIRIESS
jgi:sulfofructose kinase